MSHSDRPSASDEGEGIPFQALVEQSLVGVYVIQDEVIKYANDAFANLTGHAVAEILGMNIRQLTPPWRSEDNLSRIRRRVSGEIPSMRFRTQGWHKDGYPVDVEVHGRRVMFRGQPAVAGVAISVAESVRHEQDLHRSREQLRALAAHINDDRETQRRHIARELHDVLGGILTSIKMDSSRLRRRLTRDEDREIVDGIAELTREAIDAVRQISDSCTPACSTTWGWPRRPGANWKPSPFALASPAAWMRPNRRCPSAAPRPSPPIASSRKH